MARKKITLCPRCKKRQKYIPPSGTKVGYCKICMNLKSIGKYPTDKIDCNRGGKVATAECEENQGCNDACFTCTHFKEDKTVNSMSIEEQREAKYSTPSVMSADYVY